MAYESLYRRYRPQRFSEVRGQDHVVTALHNAVRENRVGHAYLLSGPRGTGKTSTARILAKALNCTNLVDGEPCGACESCRAIEAGTSYDLMELDAASNNGVDAMRDLIAKAALGSPGRTKVYLLDEVHMLSTGASNALLKTLEEPPGHVVFVLATTDPHKVLPTIRSRTQHFELHLLPAEELRALVDDVVADAGLDLGPDAIEYALRAGGGSARDTLSALDQVVAAGGVLDQGDRVEGLVDAIAARDTGAALRQVADSVARGHDPRVIGEALLARIRDVFLLRMGDPLARATDGERTRAAGWAEHLGDRDCTRALETIGDALREMRNAPDTRIPLEVALVRLTRADADTSLEALATRIERLERGVAAAPLPDAPAATPPGAAPRTPSGRPADAARAALGGRPPTPPPVPPDTPTGTDPRPADTPPPPPRPAEPARGGPAADTAPSGPPTTAPTPPDRTTPVPPADRSAPVAPPDPATTADRPSRPVQPTTDTPRGGDGPTDDLASVWEREVLPRLSGLTKAMFRVGHFVDPVGERDAPAARFAVPNEVQRTKSAEKLPEVEAALAAVLGRPLRLTLVVEGTRNDRPTEPAVTSAEGVGPTSTPSVVDEADEIGPIDELEDAPADDRTATQRLLDAFPGAEVVEP